MGAPVVRGGIREFAQKLPHRCSEGVSGAPHSNRVRQPVRPVGIRGATRFCIALDSLARPMRQSPSSQGLAKMTVRFVTR